MGLYTIKTFLSRKNVNSRLHNFHKILAKKMKMIYKVFYRSVAQPGSALVWGASGHGFKSRHSDQYDDNQETDTFEYPFFCCLQEKYCR